MKEWGIIFLTIVCFFPLSAYEKQSRISGILADVGAVNGRSYFSLKNLETGKLQHVLCSPDLIREIASALEHSSGKQLFIHTKVKTIRIGSPLLECVGRPLLRFDETRRFLSRGSEGRYVSGQILDADPDSGLLTIQTSSRKSYLKVDPRLATRVRDKLSSLQIQKIDGVFTYDRNLGYFVSEENSIQSQ